MTRPSNEARLQLRDACDALCVSQLFANHPFTADDTTNALEHSHVPPDPALIRVLLQNGADVNVLDIRNVRWSKHPTELLRLLAEHGYDFKPKGHRVLQDFAHDRETLDWLLDHGADISRTDTGRLDNGFNLAVGSSDNPLHLLDIVAANGDIDLFDHLVSRGADPSRSLALHAASKCQDHEKSMVIVCHLLDKHNMDINVDDETFRDTFNGVFDEGSPMCSAVINHNLAVLRKLLHRGASFSGPRSWPVSHAVEAEDGFLPALEPLLRGGADPTRALKTSVREMNLEAAKTCLKFGADPTPTLAQALEDEERRVALVAENVEYYEEHPEFWDERYAEEQKAAEKESKSMIDFLRRAIESYTASRIASL